MLFYIEIRKLPTKKREFFSALYFQRITEIDSVLLTYVVGNTKSSCFPEELMPYTEYGAAEKGDPATMRVNLLVNYGWEWDLKHDWVSKTIPRVDLVIRWGGMCRLSGFLPIQTVYADFCILQELWPDFQEEQFEYALQWYQKQDVTLGG